jgi:thiol-disulfide isomerase/thioredoxin
LELPVSSDVRLIVLLLVGVAAVACDRQKEQAPQAPVGQATPAKGIDRSHRGDEAPTATFADADGKTTDIASFAGKPVLVNLWATWCGPCVKELPTLGALAERDKAIAVVAISQDDGDQALVDSFLADKAIGRFAAYHDRDMALMSALGVQVLPTTILYDAAGREVWRFTGDLDWSGAEAARLLAEAS